MTKIGGITRRGFTGHEHLDSVGLIHMNGRVYDPVAARFLSSDPILGIGLSQDANRYSYAWNSPLNVVDPTGLIDEGIDCINGCAPEPLPEVPVPGSRWENEYGYGLDREVQIGSWGGGIELAIQLNDGIERQFAGPDGEVVVTASRVGSPSAGPGNSANKSSSDSDVGSAECSGRRVSNTQERLLEGPDYVSLAVPVKGILGIVFTTDRYGNHYLGIGVGFGYPAAGVSAGYIGDASTGQGYAAASGNQFLEIPSADATRNFISGLDSSYGAIYGVTTSGSSHDAGRSAVTITGPAFGVSYSIDVPWLNDLIGSCRSGQ